MGVDAVPDVIRMNAGTARSGIVPYEIVPLAPEYVGKVLESQVDYAAG